MTGRDPGARRLRAFVSLRERIVLAALRRALAGCRTVLDVGCGVASPLSRALSPTGHTFTIGMDRCVPDLARARAAGSHAAFVCGDAATIDHVVRPGGVDAVVALDVIEHFERAAALELVTALERVARRRVVLLTPNGFVPQPGTPENPWQEHRSGFSVDDLRARGYRVRGVHGLGFLMGPYGEVRFAPGVVWRRVADATAPFVWATPRAAFALLATKDLPG